MMKKILKLGYYSYLKIENEPNLLTYKYSGIDKSLLYNYVLSPIANFTLE